MSFAELLEVKKGMEGNTVLQSEEKKQNNCKPEDNAYDNFIFTAFRQGAIVSALSDETSNSWIFLSP